MSPVLDHGPQSAGSTQHPAELARAYERIAKLEAELRWSQRMTKLTQRLLAGEVAFKGVIKKVLGMKPAPVADFHDPDYQRYTKRRLEHLASLGLNISGASVLELGAGIGDLTDFFLDRGCRVVATEVRPESRDILRNRYKDLDVRELDLDNPGNAVKSDEMFDIVFCYGVLYHLSKPDEGIRYMAAHSRSMLLLETRVSFGQEASVNPYPEVSDSPTQSSTGGGCRPTRPWVFAELKKHFPYVYLPISQPHRAHFVTDWTVQPVEDILANSVFVASRNKLPGHMLVEDVPLRQIRS